jgi:glycosyltransferase involved in cell wall biosynthesis
MMVGRDQSDGLARAGGADPYISIVISTRNRARQLTRCLQHVGLIRSRTTWELVVVNNGSTDDTSDVLAEFEQQRSCPVKVVNEPAAGLSRARNAGVRAARGEVVVFTDDDCYVHPDLVDEYRKVFENEALGFAGGRIVLHDRTDYPLTIMESDEQRWFPAGRAVPCGVVQGANMAVRRHALEAAGEFDVRLGSPTPFIADDWDMQTRVGALGWLGGYFPGPTVSHHHGRKREHARAVIRVYNMGSGAVYLKLGADPRTRWTYLPHLLRRVLGDLKSHPYKIVQQIHGALLFLAQNRRHLLAVQPRSSDRTEVRTGSA